MARKRGGGGSTPSNQLRDTSDVKHTAEQKAMQAIGGNYSPQDLAKQVYEFPGKVYDNADQDVRGLIDLASSLFRGADPGDLAYGATQGLIHDVTNPVEFASEKPLDFALTLSGLMGAGEGLASSAASRGGFSGVPEWLADETGAIGPFGKRLETEGMPEVRSAGGGITPTYDYTGAKPDLAVGRYPEGDTGLLITKADESRQAMSEFLASQINQEAGSRLRMPGVAYGEMEYTPKDLSYIPNEHGRLQANLTPEDPVMTEGAAIEYLPGLKEIDDPYELDWNNPQVVDQTRLMNIFDEVIGNDDRAFGANFHVDENYIPVAVDQGSAFRGRYAPSLYTPQAWPEGSSLTPEELDWVKQLGEGASSVMGGGGDLKWLLERVQAILDDQRLHPDSRQWFS